MVPVVFRSTGYIIQYELYFSKYKFGVYLKNFRLRALLRINFQILSNSSATLLLFQQKNRKFNVLTFNY